MIKTVKIQTNDELQSLFGYCDQNLRAIENEFKVKITLRAEHLKINGTAAQIKKAASLIEQLLKTIRLNQGKIENTDLPRLIKNLRTLPDINRREGGTFMQSATRSEDAGVAKGVLRQGRATQLQEAEMSLLPARDIGKGSKQSDSIIGIQNPLSSVRGMKTKVIGPKTKGQREYTEAIKKHDIVFGIGPAGTGKTYLAMACAVEALNKQEVRRIILTRPAIEAGESLGFLPGDIYEKISPYLRPLYDAIYDMMDAERIEKYLETGIVEVAPLAYMRGRTLNDAFIILDEAQNCTAEQMKMFLTRLGFYSKAVITGDITQSDLPGSKPIGLLQAQEILKDIEGIKFIYFSGSDVVRHALVQRVIEAYDRTNSSK